MAWTMDTVATYVPSSVKQIELAQTIGGDIIFTMGLSALVAAAVIAVEWNTSLNSWFALMGAIVGVVRTCVAIAVGRIYRKKTCHLPSLAEATVLCMMVAPIVNGLALIAISVCLVNRIQFLLPRFGENGESLEPSSVRPQSDATVSTYTDVPSRSVSSGGLARGQKEDFEKCSDGDSEEVYIGDPTEDSAGISHRGHEEGFDEIADRSSGQDKEVGLSDDFHCDLHRDLDRDLNRDLVCDRGRYCDPGLCPAGTSVREFTRNLYPRLESVQEISTGAGSRHSDRLATRALFFNCTQDLESAPRLVPMCFSKETWREMSTLVLTGRSSSPSTSSLHGFATALDCA
jgi:hypothetical protein